MITWGRNMSRTRAKNEREKAGEKKPSSAHQ